MKTKIKLLLIVLVFCLIGGAYSLVEDQQIKDLAFDNVEALASSEGGSGTHCVGYGSMSCNGGYAEFKVIHYR